MNSQKIDDETWQLLTAFSLPSTPGNDQAAVARVAEAVAKLPLTVAQFEALKTAVAEAALNGIEHGHHFRPDLLLEVAVFASDTAVLVRITDQGSDPIPEAEEPDIYAKLAGNQSPRGWGVFLMRALVDEMRLSFDQTHHTIELKIDISNGKKVSRQQI